MIRPTDAFADLRWSASMLGAAVVAILVATGPISTAFATPPAPPPAVVDFDLDHGLAIHDATGTLELKLGVLMQSRVDVTTTPAPAGFSVPVLRPVLRARAGSLFKVFIQPELAGPTPRLLDCAVDISLLDQALSLRVGQWILPFSRAFLTPLGVLLFPELPAADAAFRAGRDTGVMLTGRHLDGMLTWDVGIFNGNGINGRNDDRDFEGVARVVWAPFGAVGYDEVQLLSHSTDLRFAVGAGITVGEVTIEKQGSEDATRTTNRWVSMALDAVVQFDWFVFQVEYYQRHRFRGVDSGTTDWGGYAQLGWTAVRDRLMLGVRTHVVDRNTNADKALRTGVDGVVSVHASGQHLKFQLRGGLEQASHEPLAGTWTLQVQVLF